MLLKLTLSVWLVCLVRGDRLKERIYTDFNADFKACFKRLNGTGEFGCTSELGGNVGVLLYIDSQNISSVEVVEFAPYIVLVSPRVFSGGLLRKLEATGNVNGIILPGTKEGKWKGQLPEEQSDDAGCPNSGSSVYPDPVDQCGALDKPWNNAGQNILWQNWGFPIFLIQNSSLSESLFNCYMRHNSGPDVSWPLCAVELNSPMYAAKDSETCWRRSTLVNTLTPQHYCDPLSDSNIVYFQSARNRTTSNNRTIVQSEKSVILVVARLDALNIFDQEEVGFDSPSTGLVTLLATAKLLKDTLGKSVRYKAGVENIMFLLLQGESFDYIGSSRVVYDMMADSFPYNLERSIQDRNIVSNGTQPIVNLKDVRLIIELGQLSNKKSSTMYLHVANRNEDIANAILALKQSSGVTFSESKRGVLPPASSQSFLKERTDVPVLMLTNFEDQYNNPYFHSIYDNSLVNNYNHSNGTQQSVVRHLAALSAALATTITKLATGTAIDAKADGELVNELLHCYTETANCSLYREASTPSGYPWSMAPRSSPFPQYISVHTGLHTILTKQILQYFTADKLDDEQTECVGEDCGSIEEEQSKCLSKNSQQEVFKYVFLVGDGCFNQSGVICGSCYKSTVDLTLAKSPAFEDEVLEGYDWASGKYPTWTESIWKSLSGRMFLQSSPTNQRFTLAIGIVVLIISFPLTYWLEKKACILFETVTPQKTPPSLDPVSL